jgi:hypothetical protein
VAGQHVLANRQPTRLNLGELHDKARHWRDKING